MPKEPELAQAFSLLHRLASLQPGERAKRGKADIKYSKISRLLTYFFKANNGQKSVFEWFCHFRAVFWHRTCFDEDDDDAVVLAVFLGTRRGAFYPPFPVVKNIDRFISQLTILY
jgi:hypothetical protein